MKNIKMFCSVAFLFAIIAVNVSFSGSISKSSNTKLKSLFSVNAATAEGGGTGQVNCYSAASISILYVFYDCGDCCGMIAKPQGESSTCTYIKDNC